MTAAMLIGANLFFFMINADKDDKGRPYRVEAERIALEIENGTYREEHLQNYNDIVGVEKQTPEEKDSFYDSDSDYLMKEIDGTLYRFDYSYGSDHTADWVLLNGCLFFAAFLMVLLLLILRKNIIAPFEKIREVPYELAKGHLSVPLKESKEKYFGRFVWGLDLLREELEQQKAGELALQKEKKTLVLSLSHDLKTPLGVIELYSKALEKDLYTDEEKKKQIAHGIHEKCEEIRAYVDQIIHASNEDFLKLEVKEGEFYLSQVIRQLQSFYADKLELLKTEFVVEDYTDCILSGDEDRAIEVLQNVMENAMKYGDGKRITVSFVTEEDCQLISIQNTGCTLSDNELSHIFESFWRGSNVGSQAGSGLGLYICQQLMHRMNGDIFAECREQTMVVTVVFSF